MSKSSSPFKRPETPTYGFVLQERDKLIVESVWQHRFLRSDHLHGLLFPKTTLRVTQARLRKLWERGFLIRHFLPKRFDGAESVAARSGQPIYSLGQAGVRLLVSAGVSLTIGTKPHRSKVGMSFIEHHLIAADFLVVVETACQKRRDFHWLDGASEIRFWHKLRAWKMSGHRGQYLIPDGAFTLKSQSGERLTFLVEIVRADVKGGNRRLVEKLALYTKLLREGFFKTVYDYPRVRAVIIATTSEERADNLRRFTQSLVHGRRLFWFGAYQAKDATGMVVSTITPETIITKPWSTVDGETVNFESITNSL